MNQVAKYLGMTGWIKVTPDGRMFLCGDKTFGKVEREGAGAGSPPRRTWGGRQKWRRGKKKYSYIKISDRA